MKQRIKELQFQAAAQIPPLLEASEWQREFTKKFAELIVREYSYDVMNLHGASPERVAMAAKHWGVEL